LQPGFKPVTSSIEVRIITDWTSKAGRRENNFAILWNILVNEELLERKVAAPV
jgi:hypothetical protein